MNRFNVYSQFGEDGILEDLLRRLGRWDAGADAPLWCVEFGAWDGKHLSNTWRLIEERGAHAVLLEPDPGRFAVLEANTRDNPRVTALRRAVGWRWENRLDAILERSPCPAELDVLSIDIDGLDHLVWSHCKRHRALVVVAEYNQTIPYEHPFEPPWDGSERTGASLITMKTLGESKGYTLVAVTETNGVFVDAEAAARAGIAGGSIRELTEGLPDYRTFLFQTPEGRFEICGNFHVMWAGIPIPPRLFQPLPWWARGRADGCGPIRRAALRWLARRYRKRFERFLVWREKRYTPPHLRG